MYQIGDCFVVQPPNCAADTIIIGRTSEDVSDILQAQEVCYYNANNSLDGKCDGGAELDFLAETKLRIILHKPGCCVWGGDYGANECNVCIAVTWGTDEPKSGSGNLKATDIVRYVLAIGTSAANAVDHIGSLIECYGAERQKINFIVCDPSNAWLVSTGGKMWAAYHFNDAHRRLAHIGLLVKKKIDKCSDSLGDALKTHGLWNGEGDLDFAACLGAPADNVSWSDDNLNGGYSYTITNMFDTLRSNATIESSRSACVSVLRATGISSHWFTATPNPRESVFKPFVFAPNPRISPLTEAAGNSATLLHQLHAQRKSFAIDNLRRLEVACVEELDKYFAEHSEADEELDELMKDCVEAEVKFYR